MKFLNIIAAALLVCSCGFIKINDQALKELVDNAVEEGSVRFSSNSGPKVYASGNLVSRTFDVGEFDKVQLDFAGDIVYQDGESFVEVVVPDNLADYLKVDVSNGKLYIRFDGVRVRNIKDAKVIVRTPVLHGLELNGAGNIEMKDAVSTDNLKLVINGAGDVEVESINVSDKFAVELNGAGDIDVENIKCGSIHLTINGAGDCEIAGAAGHAKLMINGAGEIDVTKLDCSDVDAHVSGVGKVYRK